MNLFRFLFLMGLVFIVSCGDVRYFDKMNEIGDAAELYEAGKLEETIDQLNALVLIKKNNEYAWTLLGHAYEDLDRDSLAKNAYEKALVIQPRTEEAMTGLGVLARKAGDYNKAAEHYYESLEVNPDYAQAYASLLVVELMRKRFKKAISIGLKGYELDRSDPVIASNLTVAYHYAGDSLNREKFYKISKNLGYPKMESLDLILSDEYTVFGE